MATNVFALYIAAHPLPRYQIEIANRIRNGRAVGTDFVVTRRPDGLTSILHRCELRVDAQAWIDDRMACDHEDAMNAAANMYCDTRDFDDVHDVEDAR